MNAPRDLHAAALRPGPARRVLLHALEPATAALLAEWLDTEGLVADSDTDRPGPSPALIVVELPFPRHAPPAALRALQTAWPGVPVLLLSPTLLPGISPWGEVARRLGVAAVLPAPVTCDAVRQTVRRLLPDQP